MSCGNALVNDRRTSLHTKEVNERDTRSDNGSHTAVAK